MLQIVRFFPSWELVCIFQNSMGFAQPKINWRSRHFVIFFPISNYGCWIRCQKRLDKSTGEINMIARFWRNQHETFKKITFQDRRQEWRQNNLLSNPSSKGFTAVSWLPATVFKICSANVLGNSISSSEINAGSLSCLARKKVACVWWLLFVTAPKKNHEQGKKKIHIRL